MLSSFTRPRTKENSKISFNFKPKSEIFSTVLKLVYKKYMFNVMRPDSAFRIARELPFVMQELGLESLEDLRGKLVV